MALSVKLFGLELKKRAEFFKKSLLGTIWQHVITRLLPPFTTGSSSKNNCTCRAGLELRNGSCTSCAPGKYSTGGSARCEQCPALATAPAGAASVHESQRPEDRV